MASTLSTASRCDAEPSQTRRYPGMEHRAQDLHLSPEPTEVQRTASTHEVALARLGIRGFKPKLVVRRKAPSPYATHGAMIFSCAAN
jgi:hypothetical protein